MKSVALYARVSSEQQAQQRTVASQIEALQERDPAAAERLTEKGQEDLARLEETVYFAGVEYYLPYLYPGEHTLFDYLPADALVVIDEPLRLAENYRRLQEELGHVYENRLRGGACPDCRKAIPGIWS